MARSDYIWIVRDPDIPATEDQVVAVFTVKHEMMTWTHEGKGFAHYKVRRLRDGGRDSFR